jgi:predicted HTH domain antitoxin
MTLKTIQLALPSRIEERAARFAMATGLIYQGGGIITVAEAAQLAGMEKAAFVQAVVALGPEMEEMIEQAFDMEAYREAKTEGGESIPWDKACAMLDEARQSPA